MKTLLLSFVASVLIAASAPTTVSDVYICNGPSSTKYHFKENCRGLNNCSTKVERVTLETAKGKGRTICGFED